MRVDLRFPISGSTQDELIDRATEIYRGYIGDEDAALPHSTEIEVTMESAVYSAQDGMISPASWDAMVTIIERIEKE